MTWLHELTSHVYNSLTVTINADVYSYRFSELLFTPERHQRSTDSLELSAHFALLVSIFPERTVVELPRSRTDSPNKGEIEKKINK